jgi:hypothetical protein
LAPLQTFGGLLVPEMRHGATRWLSSRKSETPTVVTRATTK